jgi:hypothetical protein
MLTLALLPWIAFATPAAAWIWPLPQIDALDAVRFDSSGIALFTQPCDSFFLGNKQSGRSNVADWIRTVRRWNSLLCVLEFIRVRKAYHDMTLRAEQAAWTLQFVCSKSRRDLKYTTCVNLHARN